ncbi:MAG TPA: hypothetical protein VMY77_10670 [Chitinophagaceae bacterium]|nr:hypothetical protein [Chitinophagaceae bacterium]
MLPTPLLKFFRGTTLALLFALLYGQSFSQTVCTLTCPQPITVNNTPGQCGAVVSFTPTTSGNCGTITSSPASGSFFRVGTTNVTVTTSTGQTCQFTVRVNDNEPPAISSVTATPNKLWSPNHKMVPVTVNYTSRDNCGIARCELSVSSNEPQNGLGDGDTSPDWQIIDDHHVNLRAERSGTGNGRIYNITVRCTDINGNSSTSTTAVTVSHDQSSNATKNSDNEKKAEDGKKKRK